MGPAPPPPPPGTYGAMGLSLSPQTALHIAVILGLSGFVWKLRAAGAGLCVQERGGHTPLHLACREGRRGCAHHLLRPPRTPPVPCDEEARAQLDRWGGDTQHGRTHGAADLSWGWGGPQRCLPLPSPAGYTPLHVAVLRKDLEMVELLLSAGADLNKAEPSCGRSPLHLAVEVQSPEVAECLLRAGADPAARMYVGYTPLYSARHRPNPRLPQLLRDFGAQEPPGDSEDSPDEGDNSDVSHALHGLMGPPTPAWPPPSLSLFIWGLPMPLAGLWGSSPPPPPPVLVVA
uniref:NF-kappa-B inhibitor alpha n=1 Tax=Aquila chrysaetos chrysaetos TaxID=223781 RepID=A0A663F9Z9_AQUCH